ncbi:MAG: transporter substrate-binding domain-containing protein [Thermodesulfobacteriota bacterium]
MPAVQSHAMRRQAPSPLTRLPAAAGCRQRLPALVSLLLLLLSAAAPARAGQPLVLNTPGNPPWHYPDQSGIADRLAHEAFRRIGLEVVIQSLPAERALLNADAGLEDGDCGRIPGLSARYPHLVQVPAVYARADFVVFTRRSDLAIRSWQDLAPLDVAIIRGHKLAEQSLPQTRSLTSVDSVDLLFTLLVKDRVDVAICERLFGSHVREKRGLAAQVRILEPPLVTQDFFIYLHERHRAFVPALAAALQGMQDDGTYDRMHGAGLMRARDEGAQ